ncbi:uncharacterized protein V3H82_008008 [Fundulus diaphanus]
MSKMESVRGSRMGKRDGNRKTTNEDLAQERKTAGSSSIHQLPDEANANPLSTDATGLTQILGELRDFRKDMKRQFDDIKSELFNVHQKIKETEDRVDLVEERAENMEQILSKMAELISQQQEKLLDQEGRSRRENIRIYNVPEGAEGSSIRDFVDKLIKDTLEIEPTMELDIERAHRALAPPPAGDRNNRPRSIVVKFLRSRTKEEILRKAWGKKGVLLHGKPIYFDHDYPPTVLQKRKEYSEAKRILKQKKIRFQSPFPAKLRVFYEGETRLYQTAAEATKDMKERGLPVPLIKPKESLAEQLSRTAWKKIGSRQASGEEREMSIRERLSEFRRETSSLQEEL